LLLCLFVASGNHILKPGPSTDFQLKLETISQDSSKKSDKLTQAASTFRPSKKPSFRPTRASTNPPKPKTQTANPSLQPSVLKNSSTAITRSKWPAFNPSQQPSVKPSRAPSLRPTQLPRLTLIPSSSFPTLDYDITTPLPIPTLTKPTHLPTINISSSPSITSAKPSFKPTRAPSLYSTHSPVKFVPTSTSAPSPTLAPSSSDDILYHSCTEDYIFGCRDKTCCTAAFFCSIDNFCEPRTDYFPTFTAIDMIYTPGRYVMTATPNAYNIYYGNFSSTHGQTFISLVDYFTQNLGGSSWWNMNTAYYQIIDGVQTFCPNSLQWVKSINLRSNYSTQALTQFDIINDLTAAISAGLLPVDENGIYSVMFAGSLSVTVNGRQKNWCGFHSAFSYANTVLKYQLVGDPSSSTIFPNRCAAIIDDSSSANGHWGADSAVNFFAHEATEIVTNYDGAWSSQGVENADFCTLRFGAPLDPELNNANIVVGQKKFLVQENWVPNYGCRISKP
jgi:hypothetical protein